MTRNSLGWRIRYSLPGAFLDNPYPRAVNGSLWSVPIELSMYVGCAIAGALTLLSKRLWFNVVFVVAFVLFSLRPDWFVLYNNVPHVRLLALAFGIGALLWVNRDAIPLSPWLAAGGLLLLVLNPGDIRAGPSRWCCSPMCCPPSRRIPRCASPRSIVSATIPTACTSTLFPSSRRPSMSRAT